MLGTDFEEYIIFCGEIDKIIKIFLAFEQFLVYIKPLNDSSSFRLHTLMNVSQVNIIFPENQLGLCLFLLLFEVRTE